MPPLPAWPLHSSTLGLRDINLEELSIRIPTLHTLCLLTTPRRASFPGNIALPIEERTRY